MTPPTKPPEPTDDILRCKSCGRESCDGTCRTRDRVVRFAKPAPKRPADPAKDRAAELLRGAIRDVADVRAAGIAMMDAGGPRYVCDKLVPQYGWLGFVVAKTKTGKTTFARALGTAVATGTPFLDRDTTRSRVLLITAEDPIQVVEHAAINISTDADGWLFLASCPLVLDEPMLKALVEVIAEKQIGLVLIATWSNVTLGLIRDENDNANAQAVAGNIHRHVGLSGVPWLIDIHAGKNEDATDEADPMMAIRGGTAVPGVADFVLHLRYAHGSPKTTRRRLSAGGRAFIDCPLMTIDFDPKSSTYSVVSGDQHAETRDTDWRLICELDALSTTPRTVHDICRAIGYGNDRQRPSQAQRKRVLNALYRRPGVGSTTIEVRGNQAAAFFLTDGGDVVTKKH